MNKKNKLCSWHMKRVAFYELVVAINKICFWHEFRAGDIANDYAIAAKFIESSSQLF